MTKEQDYYRTVKKLKIKAAKGTKLTFAERNIVNIYDRRMTKGHNRNTAQ